MPFGDELTHEPERRRPIAIAVASAPRPRDHYAWPDAEEAECLLTEINKLTRWLEDEAAAYWQQQSVQAERWLNEWPRSSHALSGYGTGRRKAALYR